MIKKVSKEVNQPLKMDKNEKCIYHRETVKHSKNSLESETPDLLDIPLSLTLPPHRLPLLRKEEFEWLFQWVFLIATFFPKPYLGDSRCNRALTLRFTPRNDACDAISFTLLKKTPPLLALFMVMPMVNINNPTISHLSLFHL